MANRFLNNISINDQYTLPASDGSANQVLATNGSGQLSFVDQSGGASLSGGATNKLAIWSGTDSLTNDTNLHWDTSNDRLGIGTATPATTLHVNGRAVIGSNNTIGSSYVANTSIIGSNNDTANTGVTTSTSVILGDGNGGRYGNVVISERTLKLGTDDDVGVTSSNSTAIIDINNNWKAGSAYSNIRGFLGYFAPPSTSNDIYWFYANDNNSLTDSSFGAGNAPEAAVMQISFSPNFGTNSAGNSSNTTSMYFAGNSSSSGAVYITASNQNTSSRGVVTIDGRYQNQNYEIPDGQKIFEVTSGYGRTKFVVESGGQNNEASIGVQKDIFHLGDTDTFFGFTGADTFGVTTGGTERLSIGNSGATFSGTSAFNTITVSGSSTFSDPVTLDSDLTLDGISSMTESTALVMNSGNEVGFRTLGSNAFNSTTIPTNNNQLTNGAGYITSSSLPTVNNGTLTLSTSAGLDGSATFTANQSGGSTFTVSLDLSELTDMTGAVDTAVDEIILLDNGAERRKRFAEIFGSNAYNSTTIPTNNSQLTNGAGYITSSGVAAKIKAGGTGPSTENLNTVADSVSTGQLEYRGFNSSSSNKPATSDNANGVITVGQHSGNYSAQLAFSSNGNVYWRDNPAGNHGSWRKMWDDGNLVMTSTGNRWDVVPTVSSSGVLEAGKYIDFHESDTTTSDYDYRITSTSGRLYFSGDIEIDGGDIYINDSSTRITEGSSNSIRLQTNSGYVDVGPQNSSWCHIYTDRNGFYFNKTTFQLLGNQVFHDGYHPNADTWTTARTITIGSTGKSVNGSGNVSWTLSEIGAAASSHTHSASDITSGTFSDLFSNSIRYNIGLIDGNASQTRDKIRVWSSSSYTIGMKSGFSYGHLNDYAMSFQMNDDSDRGWWWGDTTHTDAQGAMSLTTNGRLVVATSLSVGQGESVTSPSTEALYVSGSADVSTNVTARGHFYGRSVNGQYSNLYRMGGVYFTWDSDSYGTNFNHSITSSYGGTYGDDLTINSYHHLRINIDSNNNNTDEKFEIGQNTTGTGNVRFRVLGTGTVYAADDVIAFYSFSDKRLKTDIKPTTDNLEKILKLEPIEYRWKDGGRDGKKEIGLIAQEVEKIVPEVVRENHRLSDDDETLYKQVDYEHLVSTLIGAVQEQQKQINELKSIINGSS